MTMIEADYKFKDSREAANFIVAAIAISPKIVLWYDGTGKLPVPVTVRYKDGEEYDKVTEKTKTKAFLCVDYDKEDAFLFAGYDEDGD